MASRTMPRTTKFSQLETIFMTCFSRTPTFFNSLASLLVLVFCSGDLSSAAEPWPQFRGPSGQGYAPADSKPVQKFDEKTNVTWTADIPGIGWSSPVIWKETLWMTTATNKGRSLRLIGVDFTTGEVIHNIELFQVANPERIHNDNSYASPTPVVDADRVFACFGTFGTAAVDRKTGEILWKNNDLKIEHQGGPGSSPVGIENLLIINCDGADHQYVIALNKETGKEVWKKKRSAPFRPNRITHRAFSTPLIIESDTGKQLISIGADQCHAYEPLSGRELWHVRYTGFSNVPVPLFDGKNVVIVTGFFEPELWSVGVNGEGDVTESKRNWKYDRGVTTVPSPILVDGRIYMINEKGIIVCLNSETGKLVWKKRMLGKYSASPMLANGAIYFCSEEGKVTIIQPGDTYNILEVNRLPEPIKASPAVFGNSLLIRTKSKLYRFDEK